MSAATGLEDYIAQHGAAVSEATRCTGCLAHPAVAGDGSNDYCIACWAGMHGYDTAEYKMVRVLLTAAMNAAAEEVGDVRLVRRVVADWLAEAESE